MNGNSFIDVTPPPPSLFFLVPCLKSVLSKVLGIGIILGSVMGKATSKPFQMFVSVINPKYASYPFSNIKSIFIDSEAASDLKADWCKECRGAELQICSTGIAGHHWNNGLQYCQQISLQVRPFFKQIQSSSACSAAVGFWCCCGCDECTIVYTGNILNHFF